MTLLLSLSNSSCSILLGDRRLTQSDGSVGDDESNKLCVLFCNDARVTIAFTGLASFGGFRTQDWMRDTLYEIGKSSHTLIEILNAFQCEASRTFARVSRGIGKLYPIAFLVSGFHYTPVAHNACYLISNFGYGGQVLQPCDTLELFKVDTTDSPMVEMAGCTAAFSEQDRESLRKMLAASNSPPKLLRKTIEIVRRVSRDRRSKGLVGLQCNSGVMWPQADTSVVATYHSAKASFRAFGPDIVLAVTNYEAAVAGTFLQSGMVLAGPEIRKSEPCWCGSGKRFGSCHFKKFGSVYARLPVFRRPMQWVVAFSKKEAELIGRHYVVTSCFE
ncbi:MAG: SEC-C domain-containing protein [Pirellulales bacterium]|nr:SEC-C domain-containing protein [Pirellulales bacterium]